MFTSGIHDTQFLGMVFMIDNICVWIHDTQCLVSMIDFQYLCLVSMIHKFLALVSIMNKIYACLGNRLELLSANGGRFEINQLLFADDTALVADSEEKLCRLVSEFGRVCEKRKLRANVGKSKVMGCSRYGNGFNACDTKRFSVHAWGRKWQLKEDVKGMWYTE